MKDKERFKPIFKICSSCIILLAEVLCFWQVWIHYYNEIIKFPFWRRGNWLMAAVYSVMLYFFLRTYGGLKVGYYKKANILLSHLLSLACVNLLVYLQTALLIRGFANPYPLIAAFCLQVLLVCIWTQLFYLIHRHLFPPRKMLLIYGDRPVFQLKEKINARDDKYRIERMIHIRMGDEALLQAVDESEAVIIGDIPCQRRNLILKYCFDNGIRSYTVPKLSDIILQGAEGIDLFDTTLQLSRNRGLSPGQIFGKRVMDITLSIIFILIFSPVMLTVAAAIRLYDSGDILYRQERLTQKGKVFRVLKFRSMVMDAEKDSGARLAGKEDGRITPVGRFIRRTRLDELPQLFNVLGGDMSLVGPRPERPEIAEKYKETIPEFGYRLKMKAGLTGYAQIYGKYNTVPYDKLKLDLMYIERYSLILDLKLIIMTVKILFIKESTEGVDGKDGKA